MLLRSAPTTAHARRSLTPSAVWRCATASRFAAHRDPPAVPLLATDAQLRALPPLFLAAAEVDPLASDTYRLKRRLDWVGRNDQLKVELGVIHGFVLMTAFLEAARRVVRAAAQAANRFADSG